MLSKFEEISDVLKAYEGRNKGTIWQVVKAYQANARQGTVGVKTRAMVKSTGRKPYKQKRTGSARRGSFVSPLHVGGGVAHGPVARSYRQSINRQMARVALGIALLERVKDGAVYMGSLDFPSGKTKDAFGFLKAVWEPEGSILICLDQPSPLTLRSLRNISGLWLVHPSQLNALMLMKARKLVASPEAWKILEERVKADSKRQRDAG